MSESDSTRKVVRVSASYSSGMKVAAESGGAEMVYDPGDKLWYLIDHMDETMCDTNLVDYGGEYMRLYVNRGESGPFYCLSPEEGAGDYVDILGEGFAVIAWGTINSYPASREVLVQFAAHNNQDWFVAFPSLNPENIGWYKPFVLDPLNKVEFWHKVGWKGGLVYARRPTEEEIDEGCIPWAAMIACEWEEADFWVCGLSLKEWEKSKADGGWEEAEAADERLLRAAY